MGKTLYETWFECKPTIEHLRVCGCIYYSHVLEVKRDTFDKKKLDKGIFLRYGSYTKGYLKIKKIVLSGNVKFNEMTKWNWEWNEADRNDTIEGLNLKLTKP